MGSLHRRAEDKKVMNRRRDDKSLIRKFDRFIESRTSIILNWLWKSGLFLFLITLIVQNLTVQKQNSDKLVNNTVQIDMLAKSNNEVVAETTENTRDIGDIKLKSEKHETDIKYLRRDVDGLMRNSGFKILSKSRD